MFCIFCFYVFLTMCPRVLQLTMVMCVQKQQNNIAGVCVGLFVVVVKCPFEIINLLVGK